MTDLKYVGVQRQTKANAKIMVCLDSINNLYENGYSVSKISRTLGIDRKAIARLFKNNGEVTRPGFSYARKRFLIDEHYFDNIDTEIKAYMLGFIYADGNYLKKKNRISIKLNSKDRSLLERFSYIIYGKEYLNDFTKVNAKGIRFHYTTFNIFNKHMSEMLEWHGVVERKSKKIIFPEWLNENLYRHFIRGLIDGDGCLSFPAKQSPVTILISTTKMNDFIKSYLEQKFSIKSYKIKAFKQDIEQIYYLKIKNYRQNSILLNWLYKDAEIYLDRKFKLYLKFKEKAHSLGY
jgi:hypothetical protein